ncbi:MAG: tetratricopeptide repeat protein [Azoarcus sp.]|jgi:predicted negative regulator of RcsB-dependent stress response|nr:tetratricopeptide repeat protein [Azoarcus sp.]
MAVYDLEEQEQLSQIKAWWEQYGNLVVSLAAAAAVAMAGWQGWRWYQGDQAAGAGRLYAELQQAAAADDARRSREIAGSLVSKYAGTVQAQLGVLLSTQVQFRKNELDNALPQLEWAASTGKDAALRELARLRWATVLLQKGDAAAALARLQPAPEGPWRVRFEDLRGDALAAQGKAGEARAAWQAALDALDGAEDAGNFMRAVIRAKLESLEG